MPKPKAEANKTHLDGTTHEQVTWWAVGSRLMERKKKMYRMIIAVIEVESALKHPFV